MKQAALWMVLAGTLVGLSAGSALSYRSGKSGGDGDFALYVAPAAVVAQAPGDGVTLHTDVPYAADTAASVVVTVDGTAVAVGGVWADDRGQLVARIAADDVLALGGDDSATIGLTLVVGGEALSASDTVRVNR